MAWDQYAHPEFGFFCPTPRLRRKLRIAFVSILFGAIGGAIGVLALGAGHRNAIPNCCVCGDRQYSDRGATFEWGSNVCRCSELQRPRGRA